MYNVLKREQKETSSHPDKLYKAFALYSLLTLTLSLSLSLSLYQMEKKSSESQEPNVRKGPWTMEEDMILIDYISNNGEGVWNTLACSAGLKRTGKSCRLRWLNYLKPDVRRGNITTEEQLLIMDLHARLGNSWSKIARQLPGRTDNEIKNFWRTKIKRRIKSPGRVIDNVSSTSHTSSGEDGQVVEPSSIRVHGPQDHPGPAFAMAPPPFGEDVFLDMEELWSLHLLNGEQL